jgi:hypothetical protein
VTDGRVWTCAETQNHVYCIEPQGRIERRARGRAEPPRVVASGRPGTRISAADVAGHEVLAFLDDRKTSEGILLTAVASIDGATPVRISDDGAGATSVDVAPRGSGGLVAYVDARGAMTPVHVRTLSAHNDTLELGKDAVVFLGGAPDPFVAGALATGVDRAYFVLPIAKDASTFGMAIVALDDPPHDDEPVVWSMYPNGLDPAPVSATHGTEPIRVARVRPKEGALDAPRVVELGTLTKDGAFAAYDVVAEQASITRLLVSGDNAGLLRVTHGDSRSGLVNLLRCP